MDTVLLWVYSLQNQWNEREEPKQKQLTKKLEMNVVKSKSLQKKRLKPLTVLPTLQKAEKWYVKPWLSSAPCKHLSHIALYTFTCNACLEISLPEPRLCFGPQTSSSCDVCWQKLERCSFP